MCFHQQHAGIFFPLAWESWLPFPFSCQFSEVYLLSPMAKHLFWNMTLQSHCNDTWRCRGVRSPEMQKTCPSPTEQTSQWGREGSRGGVGGWCEQHPESGRWGPSRAALRENRGGVREDRTQRTALTQVLEERAGVTLQGWAVYLGRTNSPVCPKSRLF